MLVCFLLGLCAAAGIISGEEVQGGEGVWRFSLVSLSGAHKRGLGAYPQNAVLVCARRCRWILVLVLVARGGLGSVGSNWQRMDAMGLNLNGLREKTRQIKAQELADENGDDVKVGWGRGRSVVYRGLIMVGEGFGEGLGPL